MSFIAANCDAVLWYSGALVRIVAAFSVGEVDGAVRMGVNKVGKDASTLLASPRPQGGKEEIRICRISVTVRDFCWSFWRSRWRVESWAWRVVSRGVASVVDVEGEVPARRNSRRRRRVARVVRVSAVVSSGVGEDMVVVVME